MDLLCRYLVEHGAVLLAGSTCLLVLGSAGMLLQRSPIHRQRAGELAVLGVLVWAAVALVPLSRPFWAVSWPGPLFGREIPADAGIATYAEVAADVEVATGAQSTGEGYAATAANPAGLADGAPAAVGRGALPADPRAESHGLPRVEQSPARPDRTSPVPAVADAPTSLDPLAAGAIAGEDGPAIRLVAEALPAWLARAYLAGLVACAGWLVLGRVLLRRLLQRARAPEPWLAMLYDGMASPGGRRPRLLVSACCTRAFSLGLWRPTIVLPQSICRAEQAAAAVGHVVRHELAHARQGDAWGQLLFNLAFPLLYFHPLYWWLCVRTQLAAELVADDRAAAPEAKESYVQALVGLARERRRPGILCFSGRSMSSSPSQFCRRMQMLLARENPLAYRCSWRWRLLYAAACVTAVAAAAGTLGVPPVQAQVLSPAEAEAGVLKKEIASLQDRNAALQKQVEDLQARLKTLEAKPPVATGVGMYATGIGQSRFKGPDVKARYDAPPHERRTIALRLPPDADWTRVRQIVDHLKRLAPAVKISAEVEKGVVIMQGNWEDVGAIEALLRVADVRQLPGQQAGAAGASPAKAPGELSAAGGRPPGGLFSARAEHAPARPAAAEAPIATAVRPVLEPPQLDVVSLANSYSDALEKLEIAEAESKSTEELAKQKTVSQHEARRAAIILRAAQRRVALLRSIAEHAIKAAKLDMELLQFRLKEAEARAQAGRAGAAEVLELKTRLLRAESQLGMLERILAQ